MAVTGHDAYEVQRKGKEFDAKLETIRGLQGKAKEAAMKPFLTVSHCIRYPPTLSAFLK